MTRVRCCFLVGLIVGMVGVNVADGSTALDDELKKGDRVLIKDGFDEMEGVVVDPNGHGDTVEVEHQFGDQKITMPFPRRRLKLLRRGKDNEDSDEPRKKVRTWTDASGKFKIKASLLNTKNGKVELEKEDGRVITLAVNKLSSEDKKYLADLDRAEADENNPDNPFAGGTRSTSESSSIRSIDPEFGSNILDLDVDDWNYEPDAAKTNKKLKSIRFRVPSGKPFFNKASGLAISLNRKVAATVVTNSFEDDRSTLVVFDLEKGKGMSMATVPAGEIKIFAVSNDGKQLVTISDKHGNKTDSLNIWNVEKDDADLKAVWRIAGFHDRGGFKPESGKFIGEGKLLTIGQNIVLWDLETAEDIYTIERVEKGSVGFSANNRRFAFQQGDSFYLADTLSGECLGYIPTTNSGASMLAISQSGKFLGAMRKSDREVEVFDLETKDLVRQFTLAEPSFRSLHWVGDEYLLVDGRNLLDIALRVTVWNYHSAGLDGLGCTNDGRFWSLDKELLRGIRIPERNLSKRLSELDPESLLVLQPGDEVEIDLNLPYPQDELDEIYDHLVSQLEDNGITVQQGAELKLTATQKKLKRESMEVKDFHDHFARRGTEKLSFSPTRVSVQLMKGKESLWQRTSTYRPGHFIHLNRGESAQQAATRLSKANSSFFLKVKIPKKISRLPDGKPLGSSALFNF